MKEKEVTQSVRIHRDRVKDAKRWILDNGGTIRSFIEELISDKVKPKKK